MNGTMSIGTGVRTLADPTREDQGAQVTVRFYDEGMGIVAEGVATLSDFALASLANRANVPAEVTLFGGVTDTGAAPEGI